MSQPAYVNQFPPLSDALPHGGEEVWRVLGRPVPDMSDLPASEAEDWRMAIGRYTRVCGCQMGALVALTALACYIGLVVLIGGVGGFLASFGIGLAVFVLASGAGKVLGIARARGQLDRLLMQLARRVLEVRGPVRSH